MNDDLLRQLEAMADTSAKVDLMNKLASELCDNDTPQAAQLCQRARTLAQALGYAEGVAKSLGIVAVCELRLCDYQAALAHAQEARELLSGMDDGARMARIDNLIGNIQRHLGDYRAAAGCF